MIIEESEGYKVVFDYKEGSSAQEDHPLLFVVPMVDPVGKKTVRIDRVERERKRQMDLQCQQP